MQAVGIILLLISIGTTVGPVGAVVVIYRDNLVQLVVPPQINDIINSNSAINTITQDNGISGQGGFLTPVFVGAQIDNVSRTFAVTVNFTNTFNLNLTLNGLSAGVFCSQHNYPLGNIGINGVIEVLSGETTRITVSGAWTQVAENHFTTEHAGETAIDVNLVNLTVNVNGITVQQTEPISVGSVPLI
jgi:hypothetical protein